MRLPFQNVIADFEKKYLDTWFWAENKNKEKKVVRLLSIEKNKKENKQFLNLLSKDGIEYVAFNNDYEFDFTFPETGYFNAPKQAIMFCKKPERQWKKGCCPNNSSLITPYDAWFSIDFETYISYAFTPLPYYPVSQALYLLAAQEHLSVALNSEWAIGLSRQATNNYSLFFLRHFVSDVTPAGKFIKPAEIFEQELFDLTMSEEWDVS